MVRFLSRGLVLLLCVQMSGLPALAASVEESLLLPKDVTGRTRGSEFVSGDTSNSVLMQINLWGAINKPGIHHIPVHTDLITLIGYAGGPTDAAIMDSVTIIRRGDGKETRLKIDVDDILSGKSTSPPLLEANDVVLIPASKPLFSQNTVSVVGIIGSVLSIALVGFVLSDRFK